MTAFGSSTTVAPSFPPPRHVATRRLNNARHWTLPILFVLALASLILAVIYGVCVGQNNHRRVQLLTMSGNPPNTTMHVAGSPSGTGQSINSTKPPVQAARDDTPATQVALFFYSATLPLLSLAHATFESILLKWYPTHLTLFSAATSTLAASTPHKRISISPRRTPSKLATQLPNLLLVCTCALSAGWLVTSAFWTHCELTITDSGVCPPQIRNHLMYGILELSIAKACLGWCLAVSYAAHAFVWVNWLSVIRGWKELKRSFGVTGDVEAKMNGQDDEDEDESRPDSVAAGAAAKAGAMGKETGVHVTVKSMPPQRNGPPAVAPSFPPPPTKPSKK